MTTSPTAILVRNQARCLKCDDVLVSRHRHDFVTCSCGSLSVDGGTAYLKRSAASDQWEEQSLYAEPDPARTTLEHSDQVLSGVHHHLACLNPQRCTIHARTAHSMRAFPQSWHGTMWRVCSHGLHHPDPDELDVTALVAEHRRQGCDGCCDGAYGD